MNNSFYQQLERLESIIHSSVGIEKRMDLLKPLLSDPDVAREFWNQLDSPDWLCVLDVNGFFNSPPPAVKRENSIRYPQWLASKYLIRISDRNPSGVATIFKRIKTDNASVIGDMIDACLAMPVDTAVSLIPSIINAIEEGSLWFHFNKAADLCVNFANTKYIDDAMTLAIALFTPTHGRDKGRQNQREDHWYKKGLKELVPVLSKYNASEFLPLLCDWLKAAIQSKTYIEVGSKDDHSHHWRPAIEDHPNNRDHDFAGSMVGFVRDGFQTAIHDKRMSLDDALKLIEGYPYTAYRRLGLHLVNIFAEQNTSLAQIRMLDHDLFESHEMVHEYAMLVRDRLPLLDKTELSQWFGWIDAGPNPDQFDKYFELHQDRKATKEDWVIRKEFWQLKKLHWVSNHLDGIWKEQYNRLLIKHGEPDMADMHVSKRFERLVDVSPYSVEELQKFSFFEAIEAVTSWRPTGSSLTSPNINGLASTFEIYVATDPETFSEDSTRLIKRPAIYVSRFINQMDVAVNAGRKLNVTSVIKLCQWVADRPLSERTTPKQENELPVDTDWQGTRETISRLLKSICRAKSEDRPRYKPKIDLRESIWKLINNLCQDRVDSHIIRDIDEKDPRLCDHLDFGTNSPRGKAMEAALEFARWIANDIKVIDGKQEVVSGGLNAIPEVKSMLEQQIAAESRSFEVMSIIGSQMGLLYWIDRSWLDQHADSLFNLEGIESTPQDAKGWAAWSAFLVWMRPHIEFYRIFKEQFDYAVNQAATIETIGGHDRQPMYHLGEHLVILFGRGELGLDDDQALLRRFFLKSSPKIRSHAIGFVGQSLESEEKPPKEVIDRFMHLWAVYWDKVGKQDAQMLPDAWLFGTWFGSGYFPEQWSLDQLEQFVKVSATPEPDHAVIEKLAEIAHVDIDKSVNILSRVIKGDRESWRIHGWLESANTILGLAMKGSDHAREQAEGLIDYLGRRGFTEFRPLLGTNKESGTENGVRNL
jgi:hypothetical protein